MICPECGAAYAASEEDCAARFEHLLALDHSRQEPWGSRHGLAFAAFALQHPVRYELEVLQRAWATLFAVYERGHDPVAVVKGLRRAGKGPLTWDIPGLPEGRPEPRFSVTIADLGLFSAETYGERLDVWCCSALAGWQVLSSRFLSEKRSFSAGAGKPKRSAGGGT